MKTAFQFVLLILFINCSQAQNSDIKGLYCSSNIRKGITCLSLNDHNIAYEISLSKGSFNDVDSFSYQINGDTIRLKDHMDFYYKDNSLFWFNNKKEVVLKGGLRKASNRTIKKIQRRYDPFLKTYNLCIKNGIIDKL